MKNILHLIIPFLLFFQQLYLFAQIDDITRLPVQSPSQSVKESVPVWLSDNEIIIFYVSSEMDTIYSTKSFDRGLTWSESRKVVLIDSLENNQSNIYPAAIKTNTGRILLAWSEWKKSMKLIYSDDKAVSWSDPISILGGGNFLSWKKLSANLNLSQLNDGRIVLSFNVNNNQLSYYKTSTDDGTTWSEEVFDFRLVGLLNEVTIISLNDSTLIGVFQNKTTQIDDYGIYKQISYDNGITWSEPISIIDTESEETHPKINRIDENTLIITYLIEYDVGYQTLTQIDIHLLYSYDNGITFTDSSRFTRYIGEDDYINTSSLGDKVFLSFASERTTSDFQIHYAIIGETTEISTPPKILDVRRGQQSREDYRNKLFTLWADVIDDEQVDRVEVVFDDTSDTYLLYDDGKHNDADSADYIYGNQFPFAEREVSTTSVVSVNKIELPISNDGIIADLRTEIRQSVHVTAYDINNSLSEMEKEIVYGFRSGGFYEEGTFLFSSGFFLSGISNGNLWANAVASASLVEDYLPGTVGSNPDTSLYYIYRVRNSDPPFSESWIKWKDAVSLGSEFYDGDRDGIYNPIDKNLNGTWDTNEDMPLILGDETNWYVFNDGVPDSLRRWLSEPQGIEVRQTVFASSLPELEEVIFIKYSILNTGLIADVLDSVYFGVWEDADLGDYSDDVVGCDTLLNSGFYYNNTPDFIYGDNQPSFFTTILQGPVKVTEKLSDTAKVNYGSLIGSEQIPGAKNLDMISHTFFIGGDPNLGDPSNKSSVRNYMKGKTRHGFFPDPCDFPYGEVRDGINCSEVDPHFWFSGDPVTDVGWLSLLNEDHRNLISTGPFLLEKNKPQEIIIAYVMGRGTDYFNSITVARENVMKAIAEYKSNFAAMTYSPPPPTNPVMDYVLYHNYPNPFNPATTIRYEIPEDGLVTIKVYDILGQEVTTLLNEFKKADRYEIKFNAIGLASGVYIYRMKVNDFIESKKMILLR